MAAYIVRRLLLMIPTLLGIMIVNFVVIQAAPGGPIDQTIAQLRGAGGATERVSGGGREVGGGAQQSRGARGLDPAFIKELEKQYGFDKPPAERLLKMIVDYAT